MTNQHQDLITNNMRMVYKYCTKYHIRDEDIKQSLLLNLCEKIGDFDPNKAQCSTFVYVCCDGQLKNHHTNNKRLKRDLGNMKMIHLSTKTDDDMEIEDNYRFEDEVAFYDLLDKKISDKNCRDMLKLKLKGYTYKEIGELLGCTKQNVQQVINKYKYKLKEDN